MIVRVDHHPDERGDPWPERIHFGGRVVELVRVQDVWPGAERTYIKAEGDDGATYILRHDRLSGIFELTMYRAAGDRPPMTS